MRLKIIAASISALFAGAAIGWFVAGFGKYASAKAMAAEQEIRVPASPQQGSDGGAVSMKPPSVAKPTRKAPIRSTADAEVQKRILQKDIALMESRLADAKREADRIEAERAALKASGAFEIRDMLRQRDEALKMLGKTMSEVTICEMRKFAPDWHARVNQSILANNSKMCRQVIGMIDALLTVDASSLSGEDRKVHEEYLAKLAEVAEAFAANADAITDDMPYSKFMQADFKTFKKHVIPARELGKAEDKVLSRAVAQYLGLSDEDMKSFSEAAQESHDAVRHAMRNGYTFNQEKAKWKSGQKAEGKGK